MSSNSKIEWTDHTWNPVRGCTKISPGCKRCYAATFAERFRGVQGHAYEQGFDLRLVPSALTIPFTWSSAGMVFVNSMSDLFHADVPSTYIESVARVMEKAKWHSYQVLTKRASRMSDMLQRDLVKYAQLPHIWWGTSVEDRKYGLPRMDLLRQAPATVRFLSVEPLLEDLGELDLSGIHWVIAGGESGAGARPMKPEWVISLRDQCAVAKVPFFFKQWGGFPKGKYGRTLDGREYNEMPARPAVEIPPKAQRQVLAEDLQRSFETGHML